MPEVSHGYRKHPHKKYSTPLGSNVQLPFVFYTHLTPPGLLHILVGKLKIVHL